MFLVDHLTPLISIIHYSISSAADFMGSSRKNLEFRHGDGMMQCLWIWPFTLKSNIDRSQGREGATHYVCKYRIINEFSFHEIYENKS